MTNTVAVIGATGDVGQGLVAGLLAAGHRVVAVGRSAEKLSLLMDRFGAAGNLSALVGSVEDLPSGTELASKLAAHGMIDVIVTSINGVQTTSKVSELHPANLERIVRDNLLTHLVAARTLIPTLVEDGMYLGIGGGMADTVVPGYAAISMGQAAQRMLFRHLAGEFEGRAQKIRELLLCSVIAGESNRQNAEQHWITAEEVGRHVVAIISDPSIYPGPILSLKSRKQVGLPERKTA